MIAVVALLLFSIFLFLSGLHFYWGLGGRWASQAVVPTLPNGALTFRPGPVPTFIVAFGLLGMGLLVLSGAGVLALPLPEWVNRYGLWAIAGIFGLRAIGEFRYVGFFKTIRHTPFGHNDTRYYSPLCLAIAGLALGLVFLR
jgi:hypothetical protein